MPVKKLCSRLLGRWQAMYHRSSIQMVLSSSFTAVAVTGMIFLGLTLFRAFPTPPMPRWPRAAAGCSPRSI